VLPSEHEPWGLVVNEALGFGLYVITSDLVGCANDLITQNTGQTYPSNEISRLSDAMASCVLHLLRVPQGPKTDTAVLMNNSLNVLNHASR